MSLMRTRLAVAVAASLALAAGRVAAQDDPGQILADNPPRQAAEKLSAMLDGGNANDIRFALAAAQALAAVETLGRDFHALGPRTEVAGSLPFLRVLGEVPPVENPPAVAADDVGRVLQDFADGLATARETLAQIDGEVAVTVPVGRMGFDFDGDGRTGEGESLVAVLEAVGMVNTAPPRGGGDATLDLDGPEVEQFRLGDDPQRRPQEDVGGEPADQPAEMIRALVVDFDTADVQWLTAYTHLLGGLAEAMLAHDPTRWFEHCGHLVFVNAEQPFDFLGGRPELGLDAGTIGDVAAAIHLLRLPVRDPERLESARQHFLSAADGSRRMFELARAETDDSREWIPSGRQSAAFPNVEVTDEVIDSWLAFVGDVEDVLNGEKLIPFWRGNRAGGDVDDGADLEVEGGGGLMIGDFVFLLRQPAARPAAGRGVNLRRVFAEQRELDAVLWVQGTAAAPYLEEGELMTAESFERMRDVTDGNFLTFAAWFN